MLKICKKSKKKHKNWLKNQVAGSVNLEANL